MAEGLYFKGRSLLHYQLTLMARSNHQPEVLNFQSSVDVSLKGNANDISKSQWLDTFKK